MPYLPFPKFDRLLLRCEELHAHPTVDRFAKSLYEDTLRGPATAFRAAHLGVFAAHDALTALRADVAAALVEVERHYATGRAVLAGRHPGHVLPPTLKTCRTDTDKKLAIEELFDAIRVYTGEAWADEVLAGPLRVAGPLVMTKIVDCFHAGSALDSAQRARVKAMEEAYPRYLAFKRVVRSGHGRGSRPYARLRLRRGPTPEAAAAEPRAASNV